MTFGVDTLIWTAGFDQSHLHLLPRMREHGADVVEVARFTFDDFPAAAVRAEAERCGLGVILLSAFTGELSLISNDAAVRRRSLEFLRQGIATAAEVGASRLIGPFCSPVGFLVGRRRTSDEWARAVEGLQSLGDTLDEHRVTLALEPLNRFETFFLNTVLDGVALCEAVNHPRVGLLVDTFHANIEEKSVPQAFRQAGRHLQHVHASENDRGVPGTGHVDFPGVLSVLRQSGYEGSVVIESFGFAIPEIVAAACIWRDLAPQPESIAWEGLQYLRGL